MNDSPVDLLIIVPVYNEQAAVAAVIGEWLPVIAAHVARFRFLVIDDGSTDGTRSVLDALCARYGPRLEIISRPNRGHGQTCLEGYRTALDRGVPFVLQIDSDGQCDPRFFGGLWAQAVRLRRALRTADRAATTAGGGCWPAWWCGCSCWERAG